jgi:hypothetical protein
MVSSMIQSARDIRAGILNELDVHTRSLVTDPEVGTYAEEDFPRALAAFAATYSLYSTLVKTLHLSSDERYAYQDLSDDEQMVFARVKHNLKILNLLYGTEA